MRALITLTMLAALLAGGCDDSVLGLYFSVRNDTSQALRFGWVDDSGEFQSFGPDPSPGEEQAFPIRSELDFLFRGDCLIRDIVALDSRGREVGRRRPPLCKHELWIVEEPTPSVPEPSGS